MSARLVGSKDGKLHYEGVPIDHCTLEWLCYNYAVDDCRLWLAKDIPKGRFTVGYVDFPNRTVLVLGEREVGP